MLPRLAQPVAEACADSPESRIAAAWRAVLGVQAVSHEENFFDAGGTSLLLVRVRAELEREFARRIPVAWMFECTTVMAMAKRLKPDSANAPALPLRAANAVRQREAFARARQKRGQAGE